jgi:capsid protein
MSLNQAFSFDTGLSLWGNNSLSISDLRIISKRLHKDNIFIAPFTKSFLQLVISSGVTLRVQTTNKDKRQNLKSIWESFSVDSCVSGDMSLDDALRFYISSIIIDGDALIYVTERNGKLKLNHIPGYRVSNPTRKFSVIHFKTKEIVDLTGNFIDNGVVYDRGEIVGYTFSNLDASLPYLFIPRKNGESLSSILLKSPLSVDTDTVRGVPLLASAIKCLDDITSLVNAETKVAKIRSKIAGVLKTNNLNFDTDEKKKEFLDHLSNSIAEFNKNDASFYVPFPGTELIMSDNTGSDTSSFGLLIKPLLIFVAALYGVSYDALSHDLKDNASAIARLIYMTAWTDTAIWRNSITSKLLDPFFALLAEYNNIDLSDVNWQINCKPYGYVKSIEEINANKVAIETGQKTLAEVAAESGKDVEDIINEKAEIEKYQNTVNPDYLFALDLMARLADKPEVCKAILLNKGYTQEVINTLYGT